jgi:hypothetical protein
MLLSILRLCESDHVMEKYYCIKITKKNFMPDKIFRTGNNFPISARKPPDVPQTRIADNGEIFSR